MIIDIHTIIVNTVIDPKKIIGINARDINKVNMFKKLLKHGVIFDAVELYEDMTIKNGNHRCQAHLDLDLPLEAKIYKQGNNYRRY